MITKYEIVINGTPLSDAQKMAFNVAVNDYLMFVGTNDSLGDDDVGKSIAKSYSERLKEIIELCAPVEQQQ